MESDTVTGHIRWTRVRTDAGRGRATEHEDGFLFHCRYVRDLFIMRETGKKKRNVLPPPRSPVGHAPCFLEESRPRLAEVASETRHERWTMGYRRNEEQNREKAIG